MSEERPERFTRGPWVIHEEAEGNECPRYVIRDTVDLNPGGDMELTTFIARTNYTRSVLDDTMYAAEVKANAHLIAAAPEMYEALKIVYGDVDVLPQYAHLDYIELRVPMKSVSEVKALLSKARGEDGTP